MRCSPVDFVKYFKNIFLYWNVSDICCTYNGNTEFAVKYSSFYKKMYPQTA